MRDITLEETIYLNFTTRSFSTGVPTTLSGTPALSVLESNNATPITAGVSLQTDRASVVGLNQATIVATAANGYEAGKSYSAYISTGTVGGVSVVGEVVGQFTVQSEAAFTRLGAPAGVSIAADLLTIDNLVDDLEGKTLNLFDLIEYQRGSHTGRGNVFYWDPVNGNDSNSGLRSNLAKLTWAGVNALVAAYNHDIVIAMPGDNGAATSIDATITLDKAFTLLRGPGRDFRFKPTGTTADTVVISAAGCELSGFIVETAATGSRDAVKVTADFARIQNIWVDQSRGHGIALENASHCTLDKIVVQDAAAGGSGHAISIKSTTGNAKRNFLKNLKILLNTGDGIRFDGANATHNVISAGEAGTYIAHNTGYGINEITSADHNHLIGPGIMIEGNTSGNVNFTGANSAALNYEQFARATTLSSAMGSTFDTATDSLEALRNQGDAAWRTATGFSTHSAADVWAVATRALTDKSGFSIGTGGIGAAAFAAGAIDAAALATDAGQEIADRILARNLAGGSDGGRDVRSAMRALRNKVAIAGGTLTVYAEDDTAAAWTAATTTAAGDPLASIDPA